MPKSKTRNPKHQTPYPELKTPKPKSKKGNHIPKSQILKPKH